MKHILNYLILAFCLFFFSLQFQSCQKKTKSTIQNQLKATTESINIYEKEAADSIDAKKKTNPDYYDIEKATIQCQGFERPNTYKEYTIKIINAKTKNAIIQIKNNENSISQLPPAFCDTLARYLFQFYVKKDSIILSKKFDSTRITEKGDTLVVNNEFIVPLEVNFSFRNKVYKDERFITSRDDNGDIIEYSPMFLEFMDWIRYLCGQYYFNYNNPENAYW